MNQEPSILAMLITIYISLNAIGALIGFIDGAGHHVCDRHGNIWKEDGKQCTRYGMIPLFPAYFIIRFLMKEY